MSVSIHALPAALLTALIIASSAFALSPVMDLETSNPINAANQSVREGKFDEAIEQYRQVPSTPANRHILKYNLAVAHYRKGDIESAKSLFAEAADSSDSTLTARSSYNLGNCFYGEALQVADDDRSAAIESLRHAIAHYRGSLRANSNNADARANIELASVLLRKLQEEERQQEQQQQQQQEQPQQEREQEQEHEQEQQQPQEQVKEDPQESSDSQTSPSPDPQSKENESQPSDDPQEGESSSADTPQQDESPNSGSEGQSQSPQEKGAETGQSEPQEPQNAPSQEERSDAGDNSSARESSSNPVEDDGPVPTGELAAAGEPSPDGNPTDPSAVADATAKEGLMTKEEALKMLQAVRDRDMLRRLRQEQIERSRHVPVDRDW